MTSSNSPYVFRDEVADADDDHERPTAGGQRIVIVDGRAMSYRWYRR